MHNWSGSYIDAVHEWNCRNRTGEQSKGPEKTLEKIHKGEQNFRLTKYTLQTFRCDYAITNHKNNYR